MHNRREFIRIVAAATVLLGSAYAKGTQAKTSIPMLHEREPKAEELKYIAASKTDKMCSKCVHYTPLPASPGTGMCKLVDNRRVSAGGVCKEFKPG